MISDFLVYLGNNILSHSLTNRLKLLNSIISAKNYKYDELLDPFQIIVKDFVECSELVSYVRDYLPQMPYKNRVSGLIFRPDENSNKNLIYNFVSPVFNKQVIINTIANPSTDRINTETHQFVNFLLFETEYPDDYPLKLYDQNEQLFEYDHAVINDIHTSQYLQKVLNDIPTTVKKNGVCVRCTYMPSFAKWKPIQLIEGGTPDNISHLL
jgi:hypothetical protein